MILQGLVGGHQNVWASTVCVTGELFCQRIECGVGRGERDERSGSAQQVDYIVVVARKLSGSSERSSIGGSLRCGEDRNQLRRFGSVVVRAAGGDQTHDAGGENVFR